MGIFLLFAALFVAVKEKIKMIFPHFLPVFGILLIIIYAAHTYLRISDWSSQCHLAGITAESSKNCARAHLVNGYCLTTAGKIEEGIDEFNETIRIYPKYVDGHIQLANSYEMTEKPDLAEKTYKNLLSIKENSKKGLYHFAMFLIRNRDFKSAKEILEKADKLYPWDNEIKNKLSLVNDLLNSQYNNLLNEF
jgi:tetratricopeptide (TPR) repeat protein